MKRCPLIILLLPLFLKSQITVTGHVRDHKTGDPTPYCAVHLKNSAISALTNEEGAFAISVEKETDTLVFYMLGYNIMEAQAAEIKRNDNVMLQPKVNLLNEITVSGNDDSLYIIMNKCREKLLKALPTECKAYLHAETEKNGQPVNMLESFHNATVSNRTIKSLQLKSGRVGIAASNDKGYFMSDDASRLLSLINLTARSEYLPCIPLQLSLARLKKKFFLSRINDSDEAYHLKFKPKNDSNEYFSGEIWIDRNTFSILKITMFIANSKVHPFIPYNSGSIEKFSLALTQTFELNNAEHRITLTECSYSHNYKNNNLESRLNNGRDSVYSLSTKCVLHFYNYGETFLLPFFNFHPALTDYRKISFLPYNQIFWDRADVILKTEKQKQLEDFLNKNGLLVNYGPGIRKKFIQDGGSRRSAFYEDHYIFWSSAKRISLKKNFAYEELPTDKQVLRATLYNLKAQIFLDMNPSGDSVHFISATVFDIYRSYYKLQADSLTDCFINIFFDLYEIERREMVAEILGGVKTVERITKIYSERLKNADKISALYLKEVQSGTNFVKLKKWNDYVKEKTGVDNFRMLNIAGQASR